MSKIISAKIVTRAVGSTTTRPKVFGSAWPQAIRFGADEYSVLQKTRPTSANWQSASLRPLARVLDAQVAIQQFVLKLSLASKIVEATSQVFKKFQQQ